MKTLLYACLAAGLPAATPALPSGDETDRKATVTHPLVHDPVMAKEGDTYYLYFTGWGISSMSTKNLTDWNFCPDVFSPIPQWAIDSVPGYEGHTWAPDILFHDGNYHLFYSCSTFGKNTSAIGHAYRSTLDPAAPEPWKTTGAVIVSPADSRFNAIDPNVAIDEEGNPWMTFGSFWDGIQMVRLTPDLSATLKPEQLHTICSRRTPDDSLATAGAKANAVEAPFIFRHDGYYYLFVSFDFCCRGKKSDYKTVVGRARQINGPYLDKEGRDMARGGGSLVVADSKDFVAIGHCAAYHFDGKDYFMAHAYRRTDGASQLFLTEMTWDDEGWPIVATSK